MRYPTLLICCILFAAGLPAQLPQNLDFETVKEEQPTGWNTFGNGEYVTKISEEAHTGKHSALIRQDGEVADFHAWAYTIPAGYTGKTIKLTGYLKTENVVDGFAGLWLRLDPQAGFDNMADRGITGTTDWQKLTVELPLKPELAKSIVFGSLLVGKGTVWVDDLEVTIDGKPLAEVPEYVIVPKPADLDTAFINGSNIEFPSLTPEVIAKLTLLGKTWGLLKYHHPAVAVGDFNWDFELFRTLPGFLTTKDPAAYLNKWIKSFGELPPCEDCVELPENPVLTADHNWLQEESVGEDLRDALQALLNNRNQLDTHYYIGAAPGIGNPDFKHEADYKNMPYPDAGFRYLAAIRFWNMIHYYFPYRLEMDVDWNEALADNIPAFLEAKNEYEYERAAIKMIGQIKDTHANLWGGNNAVQEQRGKYFPPFRATFVEGELTVVDYYDPEAEPTNPLIGDVITHVDGQAVKDYVAKNRPFFPASNQAARLRDIGETILRSTDSVTNLILQRDGKTIPVAVPLAPSKEVKGLYRWYRRTKEPSYKMLDDSIGYLTLATVTNEDYAAAKKRFQNARGIIIDIRNYPSAFGPFAFGGFFIDEPTPFVKFSSMDLNNPGYFTMSEPITINPDATPFQGKVVVLINELSQSQAEYTTMAFRAGKNVTVIGSTTAGADGNVSPIPLPGGMRTMLSGLGVFYPDGGKTQRVGIVPDIELRPTQAGIAAGKDELLERAISEILGGKK